MDCPDLAIPYSVMQHVVRVESSFNPYAIGVVKGTLSRQPKTLNEALLTVKELEKRGFNFSLGLAQVNRYNLKKYGLNSYEEAFKVCPNLKAGSEILKDCYLSANRDWGKSFSCYYSGNFSTGFRHGYVQKVYGSMKQYGFEIIQPTIKSQSAHEKQLYKLNNDIRSILIRYNKGKNNQNIVITKSKSLNKKNSNIDFTTVDKLKDKQVLNLVDSRRAYLNLNESEKTDQIDSNKNADEKTQQGNSRVDSMFVF